LVEEGEGLDYMVKFERDGIRDMGIDRGMARDNCVCLAIGCLQLVNSPW
jgi:hypothetical protein